MKCCFFIGHRDAPNTLLPLLEETVEFCITRAGIRLFVVGNYGNFDKMAMSVIIKLKRLYPQIQLLQLLPYHPSKRNVELPLDFDGTFYPEGMEFVPPKFAILRANQYMAEHCEKLIAYVSFWGSNSGKIVELAKRRGVDVENLADCYQT